MNISAEQFNKLVTRDEFFDLKSEFRSDMAEVKRNVSMLLTAVDGLAKQFADFKLELLSNQVAHDRFSGSISDLEKRVSR